MTFETQEYIKRNIDEHNYLIKTLYSRDFYNKIQNIAFILSQSIKQGGTIYWCGNGGSASDSQHLAAELVGRFINDRPPISSTSLSADTSILTCISNDFSYDDVFSRQIQATAKPNDVLVGISTSGNSKNVINAVEEANNKNCETIAFLGKTGGELIKLAKNSILVKSDSTARVQECHILIGHIIIGLIERELNYD